MTDEKPRDVPPWLALFRGNLYEPRTAVSELMFDGNLRRRYRTPATLPEWLRWRSELAEALGLVEREKVAVPTALDPWSPHSKKTVVAELRAQADAVAAIVPPTSGHDAFEDALARASELLRTRAKDVNDSIACYFLIPPRCAKAVAAELRAQAEAMDRTEIDVDAGGYNTSTSLWKAGEMLRARADELDPPTTE